MVLSIFPIPCSLFSSSCLRFTREYPVGAIHGIHGTGLPMVTNFVKAYRDGDLWKPLRDSAALEGTGNGPLCVSTGLDGPVAVALIWALLCLRFDDKTREWALTPSLRGHGHAEYYELSFF